MNRVLRVARLMSIYLVMLVAHLRTIAQVFPFALGLSVTRRTFFAATSLFVARGRRADAPQYSYGSAGAGTTSASRTVTAGR